MSPTRNVWIITIAQEIRCGTKHRLLHVPVAQRIAKFTRPFRKLHIFAPDFSFSWRNLVLIWAAWQKKGECKSIFVCIFLLRVSLQRSKPFVPWSHSHFPHAHVRFAGVQRAMTTQCVQIFFLPPDVSSTSEARTVVVVTQDNGLTCLFWSFRVEVCGWGLGELGVGVAFTPMRSFCCSAWTSRPGVEHRLRLASWSLMILGTNT